MSKLKKHGFVDIDIRLQVERFSITLQELVQHRNNEVCHDTASFIVYDGNIICFVFCVTHFPLRSQPFEALKGF